MTNTEVMEQRISPELVEIADALNVVVQWDVEEDQYVVINEYDQKIYYDKDLVIIQRLLMTF